jgi:hypothetical protein
MTSDNNPSRIPVSKHTANFSAPSGAHHATQSPRGGSSQSGGQRRRRGERKQRPEIHAKKEWVIGALMGGLVLAAVLGLWVMGLRHSGAGKHEVSGADHADASAARGKWQGPVPAVIAERFMEAKSQKERLELVRNPAQVGPAMEAFFKSGPGATEKIKGFYPLPGGSSGNLAFESYNVEIDNAPARMLTVSIDPKGAKVDFECYARFGSVAWDDLLGGKVTEAAEVRVNLEPGGYYVNEFSDEQKWLHFRATSPDLPTTLDFYLDRQNPSVREIQDSRAKMFRATLALRALNGSEKSRQFEITAVKALEWVEPG